MISKLTIRIRELNRNRNFFFPFYDRDTGSVESFSLFLISPDEEGEGVKWIFFVNEEKVEDD